MINKFVNYWPIVGLIAIAIIVEIILRKYVVSTNNIPIYISCLLIVLWYLSKEINTYSTAFSQEKGKLDAQLRKIEKLTEKIENIKSEFQKKNIDYQIRYQEFISRQFSKIEEIYSNIIDLQDYIRDEMSVVKEGDELKEQIYGFHGKSKRLHLSIKKGALYITDDSIVNESIDMLNTCSKAFFAFNGIANIPPIKLNDETLMLSKYFQEIKQKNITERINYQNAFDQVVGKFPILLKKIRKLLIQYNIKPDQNV